MAPILRKLFLQHVGQTSENPLMVEIARADGIFLYSPDGKRYIDMISGVSVSNVGHSNPEVIEAVCKQAKDYMHLMVYGEIVESPQVLYAKQIASHLPETLQSVYFVNSGSEAVEGALKLAKRHTGRTELISFRNAYHGSTHGALSVMGSEEYKNSYRPMLPDVKHIGFNNFEELSQITKKTATVIIEPVQGEGGVRIPDDGFLQALRNRCDEVGALLIFDEIQTGFGRTGKMFAFLKYGVTPDIMVIAKAMGGGMPLGGFVSSDEIMSSFKTNPILGHITTFGGHPVCCAAGLAALQFLEKSKLVEDVERKSELIEKLIGGHPAVKEIRRSGLLIAVELGEGCGMFEKVIPKFVENGLMPDSFLFCETAFRIAPPLIITDQQIEEMCDLILKSL